MRRPNARSDEANDYRRLYDLAKWKRLRLWKLKHSPLCEPCLKQRRRTPATVVNHRTPHKGNLVLFFDSRNLEASCAPCHDGATQSFERTGVERGCDAQGNPNDARSHWHHHTPEGG